MCWLCGVPKNVDRCKCCKYLASSPQPHLETPAWYSETVNPTFFLQVTSYLTKIWFIDKGCFGVFRAKKATTRNQEEHRSKAGMVIGKAMWDRAKKRSISSTALLRMQSLSRQYEVPTACLPVRASHMAHSITFPTNAILGTAGRGACHPVQKGPRHLRKLSVGPNQVCRE